MLNKSHIKVLKLMLNIWTAIITILALLATFVFVSQGGYNHPFLFFVYIFVISFYINTYRLHRMTYDNDNQISLLQLKVWAMLFVRGIFASCLYLAIYAMNIFGIIFFSLTFLATFFCNHYLKKAIDIEKQFKI